MSKEKESSKQKEAITILYSTKCGSKIDGSVFKMLLAENVGELVNLQRLNT